MRPKIRPVELRDIETLRLAHNDFDTLLMLHDTKLIDEVAQRQWFQSMCQSQTSQRLVVVDAQSDAIMGVARVDRIDHVNSSVMLGLDVLSEFRGLGLSYWVYEELFRYFFDHRNINRIYLEVLETNVVAVGLYRKLLFTTEGRLRQAVYRDGRYIDCLIMSILRYEYHRDIEIHRELSTRLKDA